MGFLSPFQPAPPDYMNRLAVLPAEGVAKGAPQRLSGGRTAWLLLVLVLLCLLPRTVMALRIPSVCPDGVLYIHVAQAIDAGDWHAGLRDMSLNLYPLILVGLHRLGLGWELAATLWGVTVSSLVVLPLWGWVRRQFDDRVAMLACLLYALNPKFIEWSPEVMRDQTFWLLYMLAIYWLWRAVTEIQYGLFLAAGAAIMLAALTRFEGLFLLVPLALWTIWRLRALGAISEHSQSRPKCLVYRKKLLLGAVLCAVAFPMLLALLSAGWALGQSGWGALRLSPLARVQPWLESVLGHSGGTGGTVLDKPFGFGRMIWIFIPTMTRGLSPIFALLMFGGIWGWRRVWRRCDHQPLFYIAIVIMCGIWIQLWYDRNICPRYALPIVLMGSPFAALGLLGLVGRLMRISGWLGLGVRPQRGIVAAVAATIVLVSISDAMTSNGKYFETRQMAADLGHWVRNNYRTPPAIVGPVGITPIISFYADNAPYQPFRWEAADESILTMVRHSGAAVVLLQPAKELTDERCAALAARLKETGLEPVNRRVLPATCDGLCVLVRGGRGPRVVRTPSRVY